MRPTHPFQRIQTGLDKIRFGSVTELSDLFGTITGLPDNFGQPQRQRLFTPTRTFWLFLSQIFGMNYSCRAIVRKFLSWLAAVDGVSASVNTAAYCKARQRLRLDDIKRVHQNVVAHLSSGHNHDLTWYGRSVKVVDGSAVTLPDSAANQEQYPQPPGQRVGCGFPIIRLVALFELGTGAVLAWAYANLWQHETHLFRRLWSLLSPGDVVLMDRGFCSYVDICLLRARGVDTVCRKHQRRHDEIRVRQGSKYHDKIVRWLRPKQKPAWLSAELWATIPESIDIREIKVVITHPGYRTKTLTVVTTLLERTCYPTPAFAELYLRRWYAELYLRDLKTTLGMETLHCQTPAMVEKELWLYAIAYNLVRATMNAAGQTYQVQMPLISFKGTWDTLQQWLPLLNQASSELFSDQPLYQRMLAYIAADRLVLRPGRREPRALKRRLKNFQLLTRPRAVFQEIQHRHQYHKV
jgi:hypothetical protein